MYRVILDAATSDELHRRIHQRDLAVRTRDRLEMIRLSGAGWSIPKIAVHLRLHEITVRTWIKAYLAGGFDALDDQPHLGQASAISPDIVAQVHGWLVPEGRSWTSTQIAEKAAQELGVVRSRSQWRRILGRNGLSYKRTHRTLTHKQKPEQVAVKRADLETLQKGDASFLDLCFEDEAGFAMTLPPNYSWSPIGHPQIVPYEAPQGRRVNVLGAYFSHGPLAGRFETEVYASLPKSKAKVRRKSPEEIARDYGLTLDEVGPITAERFLAFIWRVAGRPSIHSEHWKRERPLVMVVDNYSVHASLLVQEEVAALKAADIFLFRLPSYSPELSDIEPIWQEVKHHEMPIRSYTDIAELKRAVEEALDKKAQALLNAQCQKHKQTNTLDQISKAESDKLLCATA